MNCFEMEVIEKLHKQAHQLTFKDIKEAADRIEGGIIHTPLCEAKLCKFQDYNVFLKCENLQYTGSCTERGIRNAILARGEDVNNLEVLVASLGDSALAAAYQAGTVRVPVTVVVPENTTPSVVHRCLDLGADVVTFGDSLKAAASHAKKIKTEKHILVSPDDPLVMAGLGTIGIEIVTQLPEVDAVIVPVSSGGLLASILVACKRLKCSCLVYGVECSKVPKTMRALQEGRSVDIEIVPNLAEGLNASAIGPDAFSIIKGRLDRMLEVDECFIAKAIINLLEQERLVADGAGVCAVAAVMQGLVPELRGKRAVCVISSGIVDCARLARVIQRGLSASGRLLRFAVPVPDHHKGLEQIAEVIFKERAVLKSFVTDQMWLRSDVANTWASVVVETKNAEHADTFRDHVRDVFPAARFVLPDDRNMGYS